MFPKFPESFQNSRKDSKIPGKLPKFPESFQNSRKDSKIPGKFPKFPLSFQNSQKVSKIPGKFKKFLESFQNLLEIFQLFATLYRSKSQLNLGFLSYLIKSYLISRHYQVRRSTLRSVTKQPTLELLMRETMLLHFENHLLQKKLRH